MNLLESAQDQAAPLPAEKLPPGTYLQYMGFGQIGSLRTYRFRRVARGEKAREYLVNADLGLFARHHVGIQEGPALCLRLLSETPGSRPTPESLTDTDMLAHLASRPRSPERNKYHLREPRPPSVVD